MPGCRLVRYPFQNWNKSKREKEEEKKKRGEEKEETRRNFTDSANFAHFVCAFYVVYFDGVRLDKILQPWRTKTLLIRGLISNRNVVVLDK